MTIDQFIEQLDRNKGWFLTSHHEIRCHGESGKLCCPITAGVDMPAVLADSVAVSLGLSIPNTNVIIMAADWDATARRTALLGVEERRQKLEDGFDPYVIEGIRARLLTACGLVEPQEERDAKTPA